jgi:hypothetical protein
MMLARMAVKMTAFSMMQFANFCWKGKLAQAPWKPTKLHEFMDLVFLIACGKTLDKCTVLVQVARMLEFTSGDLLYAGADALVNPVNCVGVMGRGLAAAFNSLLKNGFLRTFGCMRRLARGARWWRARCW